MKLHRPTTYSYLSHRAIVESALQALAATDLDTVTHGGMELFRSSWNAIQHVVSSLQYNIHSQNISKKNFQAHWKWFDFNRFGSTFSTGILTKIPF